MASIQSIQHVLQTYQQAYGAEALSSQLALFMKSLSSVPKPSVEKSDSPLSKLSNQELRDIWADLTGRQKGIKSSGKLSTKDSLIAEIERLRSAPAPAPAPAASSSASEDKVKSKRSGPSAWNAFVDSVAGKKGSLTAEFLAWKSAQVEKNDRLTYASSLGKAAFEEFKSTYVPSSSASSVADSASEAPSTSSSSSTTEKKKAGRPKMTDEERSAKQVAKKAAKDAEKAEKKAARAAEKAAAKSAKKSAKKTESPPDSDYKAEAHVVYTEVEVGDDTYFWDEASGDLFNREDDGSFSRIGSYDGISMSFY